MVLTGVETAGVILAVFPLLISAAEHYREGVTASEAMEKISERSRPFLLGP